MGMLAGKSARYVFAHTALRHYVLGAGSSVLGDLIGMLGLLQEHSTAVSDLCSAVREATGQSIAEAEIDVSAFEIRKGSCIIVRMPEPQCPGEAHMVAIASTIPLDALGNDDVAKLKAEPQYFTLERTRLPSARKYPAMLCQWKSCTRRDYYDKERRNYGWGPNPVASDVLDCVERIMVSGIWRSTEY
jgi:hypothetical protein